MEKGHTRDRAGAAPDEVWEAMTESEQLAGWLGTRRDRAAPGRARDVTEDGPREGWVEEYEPAERLTIWWSAGEEEATRVQFDLEETEGGTRLVVTETRPLAALETQLPSGPVMLRRLMAATDAVFGALSDPTRRGLLAALGERGPATATELAAGLPVTRQAVSKHLGALADAGWSTPSARARGALPAHPRAALRRDDMDGGRGRPVGHAAGGAASAGWATSGVRFRRLPRAYRRRRGPARRSRRRPRLAGGAQPRAGSDPRSRGLHLGGAVPRAARRARCAGW